MLLCLESVTMSSPVLFALSANHMVPRGLVLYVMYRGTVAVNQVDSKSEVKSKVIKKFWSMVTDFFGFRNQINS